MKRLLVSVAAGFIIAGLTRQLNPVSAAHRMHRGRRARCTRGAPAATANRSKPLA